MYLLRHHKTPPGIKACREYSKETLAKAIQYCIYGRFEGIIPLAAKYGVPKSTLRERVKLLGEGNYWNWSEKSLNPQQYCTCMEEKVLAQNFATIADWDN